MTYTYAVLEISEAAWAEIAGKLREAGYDHAFHDEFGEAERHRVLVDMHGIALTPARPAGAPWPS